MIIIKTYDQPTERMHCSIGVAVYYISLDNSVRRKPFKSPYYSDALDDYKMKMILRYLDNEIN